MSFSKTQKNGASRLFCCIILLYPLERHVIALFPAWWSLQAVLKFNHIPLIKLLTGQQYLGISRNSLV